MNWYLKRKLGILFFPLVSVIVSCNSPSEVGKQLQQSSVLSGVAYIDTFSISSTNIVLDSLCVDPLHYFYNAYGSSTPTAFNLLVGNYSNPFFGNVSSSAYVQFGPYSSIPSIDNSYSCDSVVLLMNYNYKYANGFYPYNISYSNAGKYYSYYTYGDTTRPLSLSFYEPSNYLPTTITAPTSKSPILGANPIYLGSTGLFYPNPYVDTILNTTYIRVKLNKSLGNRIMSNIIADPSFASNFSNYFNGLAIIPSPSNTAMLGFASTDPSALLGPFLSVFFHNTVDTSSVSFYSPSNGLAFNNITASHSSSVFLNRLQKPYDSVSTSETGNLCFVQAGSGLSVRVSFPTFLSFVNNTKETIAITNAFLVVKRSSALNIDDGGPDHKLPPPYLTLYADSLGLPRKYVPLGTTVRTDLWQTITTDRTSANPIRAIYDDVTKSYTFDLTNYLQNQALKKQTPGFIITAGYNNQLVNGLVFGDNKSNDNPMKLIVYYARIKL